MKLLSITLMNFRGYKDPKTLFIDDLTTIIGRNDVGKSSLLEALGIFFNSGQVKLENNDCNVRAEDKTVEITCEFGELPKSIVLDAQAETTLQAEYLLTTQGNLRIKKRYRFASGKVKDDVFVCAHHPSASGYEDLLELSNANLKKRCKDLSISENDVQLSSNPSMRRAIWNHGGELALKDAEIPVSKEDSKRVWEKLEQLLPMFALFQSDRSSKDSDSEVQDPMKLAVASALSEPLIQQKLSEIVDAVREKATDLATRTHEVLSKLDPKLAAKLSPEFKTEPKWSNLFSLALSDEDGIPINKRGSGVRRLILVSFFRAEAERRLAEGTARNIIYAIEEPETSQHPINQKLLLEAFQDLSSEAGCQVILTTHSPGFASFLPTSSFRFIRYGADGQPEIAMGDQDTWSDIVLALGVIPDNRVRVLLCVEGPTDVLALRALSSALHQADNTIPCLATDPRVSFVVLGGGTLCHWVNENYLRGLNRPEVHIYDRDVPGYVEYIDRVNARGDGSWGILTQKLEIENYLHCDAVNEAFGTAVRFGDDDDVPQLIGAIKGWKPNTTKRKLATLAFPRMSSDRVRERDPIGEVEDWLRRIDRMLA